MLKGVFSLSIKKKLVVLLAAAMLIFGVVGCTNTEESQEPDKQEQQGEKEQEEQKDQKDQEKPQEVVAIVNGEEIAGADFQATVNQIKSMYAQQGMDLSSEQGKQLLEQLEKQVLNSMVGQELLRQQAEKEGYTVSEKEINKELEKVKGQFENDDQFKEALDKNGTTEAQLKEEIINRGKTQQYIDDQVGEVTITEEELKEIYDSYAQQSEDMPEFEEVKAQIKEQAKSQKMQQETNKIVERLKKDSEIEILY